MKLYKVLNKGRISPYREFEFNSRKWYHCEVFDESDMECSRGFYATDLIGLPYAFNTPRKIYEVEVKGKSKEFDIYKRRFEYIKILKELKPNEVKDRIRKQKFEYDLEHALFPYNPLLKKVTPTDYDKKLLKEWGSVRDSVRYSVGDSVRYSVGDSVWDSVGHSVRNSVGHSVRDSVRDSVWDSVSNSVSNSVGDSVWDSVWDSVYAYIGSLFPNIKEWKDVKHKKGIYPFSSAAKLWNRNLVPSFDGKIWRLHSGKKAEIVYDRRIK